MQEKDLEKFIVFVESMRNEHNEAEIDVIMEGFFNIYGNKNQFTYSDRESARKAVTLSPNNLSRVWPKLYAENPEILLVALENPNYDKAKVAYEFIRKYKDTNPANKGTLGAIMEKGVQNALKKSDKLLNVARTFLTARKSDVEDVDRPKLSRSQDKAFEKEWAAGREDRAEEILLRAGLISD